MGFIPVLKAFIASVIGGLGSLSGAVVGGFVLAAIEVGLDALLPNEALGFRDAFALAIVIVILYSARRAARASGGGEMRRHFVRTGRGTALFAAPLVLIAVLGNALASPADLRVIVNFMIVLVLVLAIQSFSGNRASSASATSASWASAPMSPRC